MRATALRGGTVDQSVVDFSSPSAFATAYMLRSGRFERPALGRVQVQIFFTLLSAVILQTNPESEFMDIVLTVMVFAPLLIVVLFQFGLMKFISRMLNTRCARWISAKVVAATDRFLQTDVKYAHPDVIKQQETAKQEFKRRLRSGQKELNVQAKLNKLPPLKLKMPETTPNWKPPKDFEKKLDDFFKDLLDSDRATISEEISEESRSSEVSIAVKFQHPIQKLGRENSALISPASTDGPGRQPSRERCAQTPRAPR